MNVCACVRGVSSARNTTQPQRTCEPTPAWAAAKGEDNEKTESIHAWAAAHAPPVLTWWRLPAKGGDAVKWCGGGLKMTPGKLNGAQRT